MRDIKFRAKYFDSWYYGNLVTKKTIDDEGNPHTAYMLMGTRNENDTWIPLREEQYNTIGQFTGLRDKNGKDIYEGDIVHLDAWNPYAMQISYIDGAFCLADKDGEFLGDIYYIHHAGVEQCTIIGNIHDNPELLNQKKEK